ncbi:MAG TPA: hypothetical protein EYP33_05625 [Pyrodictium sp.]|nr:hypothetical protein [Pyrodictium sp.]
MSKRVKKNLFYVIFGVIVEEIDNQNQSIGKATIKISKEISGDICEVFFSSEKKKLGKNVSEIISHYKNEYSDTTIKKMVSVLKNMNFIDLDDDGEYFFNISSIKTKLGKEE